MACRKGGRVSIPGVYGGLADKFPIGALMEKGLTIKTGQTHVQRYSDRLLQMILDGEIDTTFLISHRLPLEEAAERLQDVQGAAERSHEGRVEAERPPTLRRHQLTQWMIRRVNDQLRRFSFAAAASTALVTCCFSSGGGNTAGRPSDWSQSSRHQPLV